MKTCARKFKPYYKKVKRELRADPRIWDKDLRFPLYKLAHMYGITVKTLITWRTEFREELEANKG